MNLIRAKLLKIDSKIDQTKGTMNHRLIFASERFDAGLEQMVPCSLPVKFNEDHFYLLEVYKGFVGRVVAVQVSMSTMDRNIYYKTAGDGKPMDLIEKPSTLQKPVGS